MNESYWGIWIALLHMCAVACAQCAGLHVCTRARAHTRQGDGKLFLCILLHLSKCGQLWPSPTWSPAWKCGIQISCVLIQAGEPSLFVKRPGTTFSATTCRVGAAPLCTLAFPLHDVLLSQIHVVSFCVILTQWFYSKVAVLGVRSLDQESRFTVLLQKFSLALGKSISSYAFNIWIHL